MMPPVNALVFLSKWHKKWVSRRRGLTCQIALPQLLEAGAQLCTSFTGAHGEAGPELSAGESWRRGPRLLQHGATLRPGCASAAARAAAEAGTRAGGRQPCGVARPGHPHRQPLRPAGEPASVGATASRGPRRGSSPLPGRRIPER